MSWLSSLFHSSHTTAPDTSAQEAEAARQKAEEDARQQALLDAQQKIYEQQKADADARAQAQLLAQQQQAQQQQQATQDLINRQIAAQEAENQRQAEAQKAAEAQAETERQAALAQAQQKAQVARDYATGRQNLIDTNTTAINDAYAGFNDDYFKNFEQSFVDYYKPKAETAYQGAVKSATYGYGDAHNLRSSAAAHSFGDLSGQLAENEGKISNAAVDSGNSFKNDIEGQKSDALSLLYSAGATGSPVLPDGSTADDVSGALGGIGQQLGAISQTAVNKAKTITAPNLDASGLSLNYSTKKPGGMVTV